MVKQVLTLTLLTALVAPPALARADDDGLSPRAIAVGESLRAAATGALATTLNPAGLALARNYVIEGSYGYRLDDHAHIESISICDSVTAKVAACLRYDHLNSDPDMPGDRSLNQASITTAVPLGASLAFGTTTRYVSYDETLMEPAPVENSLHGFVFDAGLTFRIMAPLTFAFVGYNLFGGDAAQYSRALGFGAAYNVSERLLLAADGRYDLENDVGRYGGGLEYFFAGSDGQQGIPIRGGYVYDSGTKGSYLTGGAGIITPRIGVDVGVKKQVSNGGDFMLQFSIRLFLPS